MLPTSFECYLVSKDAGGRIAAEITRRPLDELPAGDVLVRVAYSSLNYKDALAATGNPGVNKVFPHVPGVDAAGVVAASSVPQFGEGAPVIVTGFDMGANRWGGYAQYIRVPWQWIVPLPAGLTLRESMILGTAGFTAGLCVDALQRHQVTPERGEVVVTGASGGVGSMAVSILAVAGLSSGGRHRQDVRSAPTCRASGPPKSSRANRSMTAAASPFCRLAGRAASIPWAATSSRPSFAARGTAVALPRAGWPPAANCPSPSSRSFSAPLPWPASTRPGVDPSLRHKIWQRLAAAWKPAQLESMAQFIALADLPKHVDDILNGRITGRVVVKIGA